jgi:hypothetical protein
MKKRLKKVTLRDLDGGEMHRVVGGVTARCGSGDTCDTCGGGTCEGTCGEYTCGYTCHGEYSCQGTCAGTCNGTCTDCGPSCYLYLCEYTFEGDACQ